MVAVPMPLELKVEEPHMRLSVLQGMKKDLLDRIAQHLCWEDHPEIANGFSDLEWAARRQ